MNQSTTNDGRRGSQQELVIINWVAVDLIQWSSSLVFVFYGRLFV